MDQNEQQDTAKKPIVPILAVLLVAAVIAIAVLVVRMNAKEKVTIPNILYLEQERAEGELAKAGLKLGKVSEQQFPDMPFGGVVMTASPEVGTSVDEGTAVDVVLSTGRSMDEPTAVPDLTGMTPEEAEKAINDALLVPQPGTQVHSDAVAAGRVCSQSVAPGTTLPILTTITYNTSLGTEMVGVPELIGKYLDEARAALSGAGLSVDIINSYSDTVPKDMVINQGIGKDTQVAKGTTVTIEVSLGKRPAEKVLVPNVISYNLTEAKRVLESAGLKLTYTGDANGTVISIRPTPNTQVDQGTVVTLELKLPQPAQTPAPAPAPAQTQEQTQPVDNGLTANYAQDDCVNIALAFRGAGGQATGDAQNLTVSDLITGGGTLYYTINYDLGEAHYEIQVDAIEGRVNQATETIDGTENVLDANGNITSSREI